ncbi:outer membrane beta-barrel protein [Rubrivirga sp. S365]|uniref:Outer membrane beta-barrel protein n=1 Tax=Rubrivirga litoralis TaxID=3075598 RepID=A0ABU3BLV8_9BACT|nr:MULTISPECIES: outer membrane beta-barrel protein [unclassified Rubrivirga]MDT0630273.1 outer membrane beta-barrel protein [Rubrivirga sp. F394]MDT7855785.1 outer membrane beta-barrel protein [Rubrivirga sp. S365]
MLPFRSAAVLLVALAAPLAFAQDDDTPVVAGARALLFSANLDSGLTGLDGGALGIKWQSSAERALRLGLTVGAGLSISDGGGEAFGDQESQRVNLGADLLFLRYARSRTPIYLYYGLGPSASFQFSRFEADRGEQSAEQSFAGVGLGAAGVIGVEWPVSSAISLNAEYGASLDATYTYRSLEREAGPEDPQGLNESANEFGVSLVSRGAQAGVSVYF